jgi:hypothetical protein
MIKTLIALGFATIFLTSCTTTQPVVVDKNVYIAVALDEAFFTEGNCPRPIKPPSKGEDNEIMDTEIAQYMNGAHGNNKTCYNTIRAIKQKNAEGIAKVNRLNAEEKD